MADQSEEFAQALREWSERIAALAGDALVAGKLITQEQFPRAREIIAEEVLVRLSLVDYPPMPKDLRGRSSS